MGPTDFPRRRIDFPRAIRRLAAQPPVQRRRDPAARGARSTPDPSASAACRRCVRFVPVGVNATHITDEHALGTPDFLRLSAISRHDPPADGPARYRISPADLELRRCFHCCNRVEGSTAPRPAAAAMTCDATLREAAHWGKKKITSIDGHRSFPHAMHGGSCAYISRDRRSASAYPLLRHMGFSA